LVYNNRQNPGWIFVLWQQQFAIRSTPIPVSSMLPMAVFICAMILH